MARVLFGFEDTGREHSFQGTRRAVCVYENQTIPINLEQCALASIYLEQYVTCGYGNAGRKGVQGFRRGGGRRCRRGRRFVPRPSSNRPREATQTSSSAEMVTNDAVRAEVMGSKLSDNRKQQRACREGATDFGFHR
ncbi:hypothetical protein EVAR_56007_1 [Eumeta japonica]|uniref:Uncharacterized protein n=1 Tax=Eumeta variegata TaxID=151549 RepID=A0A4C1YVH1_EUMVA|nr:hypothetical protein EVAR_56007_1 [Eumeta japonica]